MSPALFLLALQLYSPPGRGAERALAEPADSARDLARAHAAQVAFERSRRTLLPAGQSGGGHCDVRLGRFCWWYDGGMPHFPPENSTIGVRRAELLAELDSASQRHPGDAWLVGMRVHYRIDGRDFARADSTAIACSAEKWWCAALRGYASHAHGDNRAADSAFSVALASMSPDSACAWRSIAPLLGDDRDAYEHLPCNARAGVERRYWMFARPRLDETPNEWKNEFYTRRVIVWLGKRSATPHLLAWGDDAEELVLRYGWPVAWSRMETASNMTDAGIIGHDPSPSFPFAAKVAFKDSLLAVGPPAWDLAEIHAEARYAPRQVHRVGGVGAQFARFRRGDSTLLVAAFAAYDDSLRRPRFTLGAATAGDTVSASAPDSGFTGHAQLMLAAAPALVGIDVADTAAGLLLRTRQSFVATRDSTTFAVSDLLFYRAGGEPAESLDSALARAIPGDTATRAKPLGLFWETYGLTADGTPLDLAVSVERVDHNWIRSTKQRLGLTPVDTPIRMKWSEARPSAGRAVSLDLTNLDSGRYRVTLTLTKDDGTSVSSTREIELTDR